MRAVVQRVSSASVTINDQKVAEIDTGLLILLGIKADDNDKDMDYIAKKIAGLRIFEDEAGKMNLSVKDVNGSLLIVPNFTLYGDATKGMRPSFILSGSVEEAKEKYDLFLKKMETYDIALKTGQFQADMKVVLTNDGPVTILLDSSKLF
jgi:D-tyrosyl-tRNA(Tyr) deacylase